MGIDNSTRVVGDFKTPLSIMRETAGEDKELEDLNNTVNHCQLILAEHCPEQWQNKSSF